MKYSMLECSEGENQKVRFLIFFMNTQLSDRSWPHILVPPGISDVTGDFLTLSTSN